MPIKRLIPYVLCLVGVVCSACATNPYNPARAEYIEAGHSHVLNVPLVLQKQDNCCGAACVAMVASYWHDTPVLAREESCPQGGFSGSELRELAAQNGLEARLYSATLHDLYRNLEATRPVIVMLANAQGGGFHYSVAVGYSHKENTLIFNDPGKGRVWILEDRFLKLWQKARRFAMVAVPGL